MATKRNRGHAQQAGFGAEHRVNHSPADQDIARLKRQIQAVLAPLADPEWARRMKKYMRGQFEFLGVPTPVRRAAVLPTLREFKPADSSALLDAARSLWRMRARDYQFAALDLLDRHQRVFTTKDLPALLKLVQEKSWWDTVDCLAGIMGGIIRRDKQRGQALMDGCVKADNLWVRRVAMLHQLGWRGETDTARLFGYAGRLAPETDFFIRKAIGWALRDYAKHDRPAVERFVHGKETGLSGLSRREALLLRNQARN